MRYAARRDANEKAVVALARTLGFECVYAPPLDLWVCLRGKWKPVEVKDGNKRYTADEADFIKRCDEAGNPVETWRCLGDVVNAAEEW
jgi:hypothetical protein